MHASVWFILSAGLIFGAFEAPSAAPTRYPADFFVAPSGNDTLDGRSPVVRGRSGPFATVQRAQQAVRDLRRREPGRTRPIVVQIAGGTYTLGEPLVFTPEDSGTESAPTIYRAAPGATPVLTGGRRITGWTEVAPGRWRVTLPEVAAGTWRFGQLYVNGERRRRPRLPRSGWFFVEAEVPPSEPNRERGYDGFRFRAGDIRPDWYNLQDVEVLPVHIWTMSRFRIAHVDASERVVRFAGHTPGTHSWTRIPAGHRYLIENVREALTEPGEWYLDTRTGELTYLPLPGEDPGRTEAIAPVLETLLRLEGNVERRQWVQHLQFHELTFAHAGWVTPLQGQSFPQAEANLSAAITAQGARDCVFERCRVTQVGGYGIELGAGCKRCQIVRCELTDLGAGGIRIGEMAYREDPEAVASHNRVERCRIAHGGRIHSAGIGVWIGHAPYNQIVRNEIYDFYYTGVSVGWSWGYGSSHSHHNLIERNHIYQIGQGVLSDMGGIYTLGVSPGMVLRGNIIHDVEAFDYGGWGIYFDEGTTGALAEYNLVYRTKDSGFHQHYGKENRVVNNIFAFGREAQIKRSRAEAHRSFTFERNIIVWKKDAPLLGGQWQDDRFLLDYNLYWPVDGQPVRFLEWTFEQWQARGQDRHSLIADPGFVNPEAADFRLRPGSPAKKIGFQPLDLKGVGAPEWRARKERTFPRAFPPRP